MIKHTHKTTAIMPSISVVFHVHVCVWFVCVIINTTYQKTSGKQFFGEKKHLKLFWRTKHKTENRNQADIFHFSRGPILSHSYPMSLHSPLLFLFQSQKIKVPVLRKLIYSTYYSMMALLTATVK